MNITVRINSQQKEPLTYQNMNDELILSFQHFKDYMDFAYKTPKNLEIVKTLPLTIILNNLNDLAKQNIPNNDLYFDLANLPLKDIKFVVNYLENKENVFFKTKYDNYKYATKTELINTLNKLEQMAKPFQNKTPAEITLCLYDLIRTRPYIVYDKEEIYSDYSYSRDLCQIMNNNYNVCLGYANLFSALLELLGLKSDILIWNNQITNISHASNLVYLNDPIYQIHGAYAFDITYDRLKEQDNPVLNYRWALLPFYFDLTYRTNGALVPSNLGMMGTFLNHIKTFKQTNSTRNKQEIIAEINYFHQLLGFSLINKDISFATLKKYINNLINTKYLDEKTLSILLINCRNFEKLFNHQLFTLNIKDINKIINSNLAYQNLQAKRTRKF